MIDKAIAVIDSGIGGLSVLKKLLEALPEENFLYFGDNGNAPYGNKGERELLKIASENLSFISSFNIKALVVACNTLSLTVFDNIKEMIEVPVYGVFPPVERAQTSGESTLLLATERTADRYSRYENVTVLGLKNLVEEIEKNPAELGKIDIGKHVPAKYAGYHTVIFGCTHYFFVKSKIIDHLKPHIIIDGADLTVQKLKYDLKNAKSSVNSLRNRVSFVGKFRKENESFWKNVVNRVQFK